VVLISVVRLGGVVGVGFVRRGIGVLAHRDGQSMAATRVDVYGRRALAAGVAVRPVPGVVAVPMTGPVRPMVVRRPRPALPPVVARRSVAVSARPLVSPTRPAGVAGPTMTVRLTRTAGTVRMAGFVRMGMPGTGSVGRLRVARPHRHVRPGRRPPPTARLPRIRRPTMPTG
jgi:hypothetical protein